MESHGYPATVDSLSCAAPLTIPLPPHRGWHAGNDRMILFVKLLAPSAIYCLTSSSKLFQVNVPFCSTSRGVFKSTYINLHQKFVRGGAGQHDLKVEGLLDLVVGCHVKVAQAHQEVDPVPLVRVRKWPCRQGPKVSILWPATSRARVLYLYVLFFFLTLVTGPEAPAGPPGAPPPAVQWYLARKKQRPYSRTMPRALWCPWGGLLFLMSEVPLKMTSSGARWPRHFKK